jgi:uncharacterized membrane protein YkvA (DUF1232 family)
MTTTKTEAFDVGETLAFLTFHAKTVGRAMVNHGLKLWFVLQSSHTPMKVKMPIAAALVYFGCPIDAVPDFVPLVGFTDDAAAVAGAVALAHVYITPQIVEDADRVTVNILGA